MNNATWSLAIDACHLFDDSAQEDLAALIDDLDGDGLAEFLANIAPMLDAEILSTSATNYEPYGASAALLVGSSVLAHLDKSHLAAHTYIDKPSGAGLATHRVGFELSTCGDMPLPRLLTEITARCQPQLLVVRLGLAGIIRNESGTPEFAAMNIPLGEIAGYQWMRQDASVNAVSGIALADDCPKGLMAAWQQMVDQIQ